MKQQHTQHWNNRSIQWDVKWSSLSDWFTLSRILTYLNESSAGNTFTPAVRIFYAQCKSCSWKFHKKQHSWLNHKVSATTVRPTVRNKNSSGNGGRIFLNFWGRDTMTVTKVKEWWWLGITDSCPVLASEKSLIKAINALKIVRGWGLRRFSTSPTNRRGKALSPIFIRRRRTTSFNEYGM